jgi:hypothetical protein
MQLRLIKIDRAARIICGDFFCDCEGGRDGTDTNTAQQFLLELVNITNGELSKKRMRD